MRRTFLALSVLLVLGLPRPAPAAEATIGVAAPLGDSHALLGRQLLAGVRAAAAGDGRLPLMVEDDDCSAEGGAAAARRFAERKVAVVVGFLCTEAIEAALPVLKEAGIPVVTPGVRTDSLTDRRDRTGWPVFRLAPRDDAEEKAVADIFVRRWRDLPFAIVDDGTIYGRDLSENLRAAAELAGLKPVFVDTYRPQLENQIGLVGRLKRAGATHVFVGGDRGDVAIIARDAQKLGYGLTVAAGEVLATETSPVPLAEGTLMVGLPRWADHAAPEALDALKRAGTVPEGYVLLGFAAFQVAGQAATTALQTGRSVAEILSETGFPTAIGTVRFDGKGDLERSLYRLYRYDGKDFREIP